MYLRQSARNAPTSKLHHLQIAENVWDPANQRSRASCTTAVRVRRFPNGHRTDAPPRAQHSQTLFASELAAGDDGRKSSIGPGPIGNAVRAGGVVDVGWARLLIGEVIDRLHASSSFPWSGRWRRLGGTPGHARRRRTVAVASSRGWPKRCASPKGLRGARSAARCNARPWIRCLKRTKTPWRQG